MFGTSESDHVASSTNLNTDDTGFDCLARSASVSRSRVVMQVHRIATNNPH